jgi:hypothetical protein
MVTISDQTVSLFVVHSTLIPNHTNIFVTGPPVYSTVTQTSPPIPQATSSYGVCNDVFTDLQCIQNHNPPLWIVLIDHLQCNHVQLVSLNENKLDIDMGNSKLYQKPYKANFDFVTYPMVGVCLILLNLVGAHKLIY